MKINLNNRKFRATSNSKNGEVSTETIFNYFQEGAIVWAEYSGGEITKGNLLGTKTSEDSIHFVYQHINTKGELLTGKCDSKITLNLNQKIVLNETWQWTCGDFSHGTSVLEEI